MLGTIEATICMSENVGHTSPVIPESRAANAHAQTAALARLPRDCLHPAPDIFGYVGGGADGDGSQENAKLLAAYPPDFILDAHRLSDGLCDLDERFVPLEVPEAVVDLLEA
jgi:hypothetical protein